jgi:hypothetical protein
MFAARSALARRQGPCRGPCLTDAAAETAPGGLFVGRKPLCGGPNVNLSGVAAAVCVGGVISTSLSLVP